MFVTVLSFAETILSVVKAGGVVGTMKLHSSIKILPAPVVVRWLTLRSMLHWG